MANTKNNVPLCAVDYAFRRIGGKYKGRILWHLRMGTILRFGELRRTLPDITPKMLAQSLKELEADKLVFSRRYHEVPMRVEYALTDTGAELIPFIDYLRAWGEKEIKVRKGETSLAEATE